MAGKACAAQPRATPDSREVIAYAEGRRASVEGELSTTNPHADGTPESDAWHRGWATWETGGTDRAQDCTAYPIRLADRTGAATVDSGDATGLTWDFVLTDPLPTTVDFGDGEAVETDDGATSHVYPPEDGTYTATWSVGNLVIATDEVAVTYVEPAP